MPVVKTATWGNITVRINVSVNTTAADREIFIKRVSGAFDLGILTAQRGENNPDSEGRSSTPIMNEIMTGMNPNGPPRTIDIFDSESDQLNGITVSRTWGQDALGSAHWSTNGAQTGDSTTNPQTRTDLRVWINPARVTNFPEAIRILWHEFKHLFTTTRHEDQAPKLGEIKTPVTVAWEKDLVELGTEIAGTEDPEGILTVRRSDGLSVRDPADPDPQYGVRKLEPGQWSELEDDQKRAIACFLFGTKILTRNGESEIQDIVRGDFVKSYDLQSNFLLDGIVSNTFLRNSSCIIDLHGLRLTPGHVCATDGGKFETIYEILIKDGFIVDALGCAIRARTGCTNGSREDEVFEVQLENYGISRRTVIVGVRGGMPVALDERAQNEPKAITICHLYSLVASKLNSEVKYLMNFDSESLSDDQDLFIVYIKGEGNYRPKILRNIPSPIFEREFEI